MPIYSVTLYFYVVLFVAAGLNHLINPKFYNKFIPSAIPKRPTNYISGILEIALGVGLIFIDTRYWSAIGIFWLMIAFLPLHVVDVMRDKPAIGSKTIAIIRLPVQFLLIWGAWWLAQNS